MLHKVPARYQQGTSKVPARSKSAGRMVRDEKESILRKRDGGRKGSSSSRRDGWNRRVVGRKDWDGSSSSSSSSSRVRSWWKSSSSSSSSGSISVDNVAKFEQRRVVSGKRRREPHVVVHLDLNRVSKRGSMSGACE